jgi:hypothetical protein
LAKQGRNVDCGTAHGAMMSLRQARAVFTRDNRLHSTRIAPPQQKLACILSGHCQIDPDAGKADVRQHVTHLCIAAQVLGTALRPFSRAFSTLTG